jgi:hypothetical protein
MLYSIYYTVYTVQYTLDSMPHKICNTVCIRYRHKSIIKFIILYKEIFPNFVGECEVGTGLTTILKYFSPLLPTDSPIKAWVSLLSAGFIVYTVPIHYTYHADGIF